MKKAWKFLKITLGLLLTIILLLLAYIQFTPIPIHDVTPPELQVSMDSVSIQNGEKIASMSCVICHRSSDRKLGGSITTDNEAFGKVYAPNITQHKTKGIGNYTQGELALMLRTGIKKNGEYAPPWMPKYPNLADDDLHDLIAFLKSDRPMVQPSENIVPPSEYNLLTKALIKLKAFGPLPWPAEKISLPNTSDPASHGKYLATAIYECYSCHSEDFTTVNLQIPENTPGYFSGGNVFTGTDKTRIYSANLTMDKTTGIGEWTEEQFVKSLKYGLDPKGGASNRSPMLPFSLLTDDEAKAIFAYLKTIPVIENTSLAELRGK